MKVLLVNHLLDRVSGGGTAERTFQIGRFLSKLGVDCIFLTLDIGISDERLTQLKGVVALPCRNRRFFVPEVSSSEIDAWVSKVDVVHLSGHWTILNARVYQSCRRLGTPYLFCPAGAFKPFGRSLWIKRLYNLLVGNRIARDASACVAITDAERDEFSHSGIAADAITVIPNGIDLDEYQLIDPESQLLSFRQAHSLGDVSFILFLGRLSAIKGPDILLEAFGRLQSSKRKMHLVLAGPDDGMQVELERRAEALDISERVHFVGFLGGADKVSALRSATLLAIPSRREAMSIVVLEAGACDCPVLFTNTCGLGELAEAQAGCMVSPVASEMAAALDAILEDVDSTNASAKRLSLITKERFLWPVQAGRYLELLHRVVNQSAHRGARAV